MTKYTVQITEIRTQRLEVAAETTEEAVQKVKDVYYDGDIVQASEDYAEGAVQFEVVDAMVQHTETVSLTQEKEIPFQS